MKQVRFDIYLFFDIDDDDSERIGGRGPNRSADEYLHNEGDDGIYQDLTDCIVELDCKPKIISFTAKGKYVRCVVEIEDGIEIDEDEISENLCDLIDNTDYRTITYAYSAMDYDGDYTPFKADIRLSTDTILKIEIL